jgi:luciferase family oxidoreductase group 1
MAVLSILDLVPIAEGSDASIALQNARDLARVGERHGYHRYWIAEHHNFLSSASAATAVVIGYVASATTTIRVGAGGIMLPNHSPLVIAEQFGTLDAMFPGRIDLGIGRAPGTDAATARALRRQPDTPEIYAQDIDELISYFRPRLGDERILAIPGAGRNLPIWILSSSVDGAELAAERGLPYAFAMHFAPGKILSSIRTYRDRFVPSAQLSEPYVTLAVHVVAADSDSRAKQLFTSLDQRFLNAQVGRPGAIMPPVMDVDHWFDVAAKTPDMAGALATAVIGSPETVRRSLARIGEVYDVDEIMITTQIYDHSERVRSFEIAAQSFPAP